MKNDEVKSWRDKLPTLIAITTLILAAAATLTAFKAAGYGNRMVLAQSQASDQWAYYQAKSVKETVYKAQIETLAALGKVNEAEAAKRLQTFEKEVQRYAQERAEIEAAAKALEKERDTAQKYNQVFGQALMFLQVGILLSSLAAINKAALYWYAGCASGVVGIALFCYAMFIM